MTLFMVCLQVLAPDVNHLVRYGRGSCWCVRVLSYRELACLQDPDHRSSDHIGIRLPEVSVTNNKVVKASVYCFTRLENRFTVCSAS